MQTGMPLLLGNVAACNQVSDNVQIVNDIVHVYYASEPLWAGCSRFSDS